MRRFQAKNTNHTTRKKKNRVSIISAKETNKNNVKRKRGIVWGCGCLYNLQKHLNKQDKRMKGLLTKNVYDFVALAN